MTLTVQLNLSNIDKAILIAEEKGYTITEAGDVIGVRGKPLALKVSKIGYQWFSIKMPGRKTAMNIPVHKFQAYQKYGKVVFFPEIVVRHIDGNPLNNHIDNILIGNVQDNCLDIPPDERLRKAIHASSHLRKFTDKEVTMIRRDRSNGMTYKQLKEKYGAGKSTLSYLFNSALY